MSNAELVVAPSGVDDELALPREPGFFRRFWGRHPRALDILTAVFCLLLAVPSAALRAPLPNDVQHIPWPLTQPALFITFGISVLSCVALVWRRRFPISVFVLAAVPFMLLQPAVVVLISPVLVVASYTLATERTPRIAWSLAGGATVITAITTTLYGMAGALQVVNTVGATSTTIVSLIIGLLLGTTVGGRRRYEGALIARSQQLLVEREQRGKLAAADERARIAREMHDIVSHSLTVIVALSEGAAATPDPDRARQATDAIGSTARRALTEMRLMLGVLRDDDGEDAPLRPTTGEAIEEVVAAAQRAGFPVTLSVSGVATAPEPVAFALSRVVQEGLTNAMRHAPNATTIRVRVVHSAGSVRAEVQNDGVVATDRPGGYGLRGLAERVAHAGGTVTSTRQADGTWLLIAELPYPAPTDQPEAQPEEL